MFPGTFEDALLSEADFYERTYPGRFESYIYNGIDHTVMTRSAFHRVDIDGQSPAEWLDDMVDDPEDWDSRRD